MPDLEQTGEVPGEDDLVKVSLQIDPAAVERGLVTLAFMSGPDKVRVWADPTKTQLLAPQLPWSWSTPDETIPKFVYLEGIKVSNTPGDIRLRLSTTISNVTRRTQTKSC